ncbi:MAG TPA: thiamine pyrophosphate-binding protein, partial [Steroidobacteraceae bacterium]|nr:thiamine pyrophosphate-binding protein [Steroidobacteraceae bacterium]
MSASGHRTLGQYLVESLQAAGVQHVFGIPGIHNLEMYRGLEHAALRHIGARHEQGLGFMADGYARVSGRPGVCWTISGPGVSNIATALGQAYADSVPLLLIASQNRRGEAGSGRGFLHELPDQRALADALTAASFLIDAPDALPAALSRSFELFATGRPRPVYIEIPRDVLAADAGSLPLPRFGAAAPRAPAALLAAAARSLREARRPLVLAGGGARRAAGPLRALAERLNAPVVMTTNARGLLPPAHELAVAASPSLEAVRALIAAADLVLAVGTEIGPTDYDMFELRGFPPPARLLRIDIDARQLNRNATACLGICADAAATLQELSQQDLRDPGDRWPRARAAAAAAAARTGARAELPARARRHVELLDAIRDALPEAVLVGDSTQPVYA